MKRRVFFHSLVGACLVCAALVGCSQQPTNLSGPVGVIQASSGADAGIAASESASSDGRGAVQSGDVAGPPQGFKTVVLSVPGMT